MKIRNVLTDDWPAIDEIQARAYNPSLREDVAVLMEKVKASNETSRVCVDEGAEGLESKVVAYCIAYSHPKYELPNLNEFFDSAFSDDSTLDKPFDNLFLHDLAVHPVMQGHGFASQLFETLVANAEQLGYVSMSLVAVQNSSEFWASKGFVIEPKLIFEAEKYGAGSKYMVKML